MEGINPRTLVFNEQIERVINAIKPEQPKKTRLEGALEESWRVIDKNNQENASLYASTTILNSNMPPEPYRLPNTEANLLFGIEILIIALISLLVVEKIIRSYRNTPPEQKK